MKICVSTNEVKIKPNAIFKAIALGALFMACSVIHFFLPLDPEDVYTFDTPADVFGIVFMAFWLIMVLTMGCAAFITGSKTVTINETGVICKCLWSKKMLTWAEIKDFGMSYYGQTKGEGNTYTLYFATKEQKTKNECKKKLKGEMIKIYVIGDTYYEAIGKVFPFCRNFTQITPFIAEDKFHFI